MDELTKTLFDALKNGSPDFRRGFVESFLGSRLASQVRENRRARKWTQNKLAQAAKMHQSSISEMESIEHDSWTTDTLQRLAEAFGLVLVVKFASYGEILGDLAHGHEASWLVPPTFEEDPVFSGKTQSRHSAALFPSSVNTESSPIFPAFPGVLDSFSLGRMTLKTGGTAVGSIQEDSR